MPAADPRDARDPVGGGSCRPPGPPRGPVMPPTTPERCPGLRLDAAPSRSASRTGMLIRGPVSLPVAW